MIAVMIVVFYTIITAMCLYTVLYDGYDGYDRWLDRT